MVIDGVFFGSPKWFGVPREPVMGPRYAETKYSITTSFLEALPGLIQRAASETGGCRLYGRPTLVVYAAAFTAELPDWLIKLEVSDLDNPADWFRGHGGSLRNELEQRITGYLKSQNMEPGSANAPSFRVRVVALHGI